MNRVYVLYLLCIGVSLGFLTTYFSITFPEYSTSIIYIINMILISSIVLLFLVNDTTQSFPNKLLLISSLLLIFYFGLIIFDNIVILTLFGKKVVEIFSTFILLSSISLVGLLSIYLVDRKLVKNKLILLLLFSPLLIFSIWILITSSYFNNFELLSSTLNYFILISSSLFSVVILFNLLKSSFNVLPFRVKYLLFSFGIFLIILFSGFRQADFLVNISPIFSLIGCFFIILSLINQQSLRLHEKILTKIFNSFNQKNQKKFVSFIKKEIKKQKEINILFLFNRIKIIDNPKISNKIEKELYDNLLLNCFKWIRKEIKYSSYFINDLKKYYNSQMFLTKKLKKELI